MAVVRFIEEPKEIFRFRYESDRGPHGNIKGCNTKLKGKAGPRIQITGYDGSVKVEVSLMTNTSPKKQHVHTLSPSKGGRFQNGVYQKRLSVLRQGTDLEIAGVYIRQFRKNEVEDILRKRIRSEKDLKKEVEVMKSNLHEVLLCVKVFTEENFLLALCYSRPINNNKTPNQKLIIEGLSHYSVPANQNIPMILLCNKIKRDDIAIRMYDKNGWSANASFSESNVHHDVAITFIVPLYEDLEITEPVAVFIELYQPSDNKTSNSLAMQYLPDDVKRKKRKPTPFSASTEDISTVRSTTESFTGTKQLVNNFIDSTTIPDDTTVMSFIEDFDENLFNAADFQEPPQLNQSLGQQASEFPSEEQDLSTINYKDISDPLCSSGLPQSVENHNFIQQQGLQQISQIIYHYAEHQGPELNSPVVKDCMWSNPLGTDGTSGLSKSESESNYSQQPTISDFEESDLEIDSIEQNSSVLISRGFSGENEKTLVILTKASEKKKMELLKTEPMYVKILAVFQEFYKTKDICSLLIALSRLSQEELSDKIKKKMFKNPREFAMKISKNDLKMDFNKIDSKGNSIFHIAAKNGSSEILSIIHFLWKRNRNCNLEILNKLNYDGLAPLHVAVNANQLECIRKLCELDLNVNIQVGTTGFTALHLAVEKKQVEIVQLLLEQENICANIKNFKGQTPLHLAEIKNNKIITEMLKRVGDVNDTEEAFCLNDDSSDEEIVNEIQPEQKESQVMVNSIWRTVMDYLPWRGINQ